MSVPAMALVLAGGFVGYWIAARVGALGLLRIGEGDMSHSRDTMANSGDAAAPSPPEKRLFVVGVRKPHREWSYATTQEDSGGLVERRASKGAA